MKEMRIATARSPSASPARSKRHPPSPRVDCVVSFPSSKRVHGNRPSDPHPNPRRAKQPSVWRRVSGYSILPEDLVVCATATKKCHLDDPSDGTLTMDIDPKATCPPLVDNNNRAVVDVSHKFTIKAVPSKEKPQETDPHKISQRQKQIDYGKNTLGYERYLELVPRGQRKKCHPHTPNIKQVCSKRSWDGQVKKWRRLLHEYDPPVNDDDESPELFSLGGGDSDTAKDPDNRGMTVDSESTPTGNSEAVGTMYDDWDEMEP